MVVYTNALVIALAGFVSANSILPVDKCELKDSKCMEKAFQDALPVFVAGLPDVGTDVLDVMDLEHIDFDLLGLKYTLDEGKLKGLKTVVIDKIIWDSDKKRIEIEFHFDCLINGRYTTNGKLLMLPITGDGMVEMDYKNLAEKWLVDYDIKKNGDGKDIVELTKYNVEYEVKGSARFGATNLLNGNKQLSAAMLKFMNENWNEVTQKFVRPVLQVATKKIIKNINKYLKATPIEDLVKI